MSQKHPNTNISIHCNRHDVQIEVDHAFELENDWFTICFSLDALVYVSYEQAAGLAQSLLNALQDHDLKVKDHDAKVEAIKKRNALNAAASEESQGDDPAETPGLNSEI